MLRRRAALAGAALGCAALSAALRWAIVRRDVDCLRAACLAKAGLIVLNAPGDDSAPGVSLGLSLARAPLTGACASCRLDNVEFLEKWATQLYIPTHARLAPFFVGAALAAALRDAAAATPRGASSWPRRAVLASALIWLLDRHALPTPLSPSAALPWIMIEAAGGLIDALAWSILIFAAVAPRGHWLFCDTLHRITYAPFWKVPAGYTFHVYCLHWPILMALLKHVRPLPEGALQAFSLLAAVTLVATALCAVAFQAVEQRGLGICGRVWDRAAWAHAKTR
mmetsp:Transcript_8191/g.28996  ORF Transcript_8191/g.28996 Transcript_8191/m.28996 type:complete len:282 (-) Transcript_8191:206-1051(-)